MDLINHVKVCSFSGLGADVNQTPPKYFVSLVGKIKLVCFCTVLLSLDLESKPLK